LFRVFFCFLSFISLHRDARLWLTCIVLVFVHFIFHIHLHLCLSGHSLKLCSIGLPSHMVASFIARLCTRKTKGIHPGRASPPLLAFRRLECPTLHHSTISNRSSFAQLACRTCTIVGFIARFCSLGNERDSFWESVPSPIISNYSRLRLRPRKIFFRKESFAQLACRVYIIVGLIARFFIVSEMKGIPIGRASPPHLPDSAFFCTGFCYCLPFMFLPQGILILGTYSHSTKGY
jgi:hypothetical protein